MYIYKFTCVCICIYVYIYACVRRYRTKIAITLLFVWSQVVINGIGRGLDLGEKIIARAEACAEGGAIYTSAANLENVCIMYIVYVYEIGIYLYLYLYPACVEGGAIYASASNLENVCNIY